MGNRDQARSGQPGAPGDAVAAFSPQPKEVSAASTPPVDVARAQPRPSSTEAGMDGAESGAVSTWRPPPTVGKYSIKSVLGFGGMGQVYRAWDEDLQRDVAVKLILGIEPDAMARERFMIEARATARIQHANVVSIYGVDELEGRPYLVMEYLSGPTLDEITKPVHWSRALELGVQLSAGLAAAHRHGVLHRDIKPGNAMMTGEGSVKLVDFGLAKRLATPNVLQLAAPTLRTRASTGAEDAGPVLPARSDLERPALTDAGAAVGTPGYMAPESWRGGATAQSDVYSLGGLLFELCAGHTPYAGIAPHALSFAVQERDAPLLTAIVGTVDPRFAAIVARCLSRDPSARYASGEELHEALQALERPACSGALPVGDPRRSQPSSRSPSAGSAAGADPGRETMVAVKTMVFREVGALVVSVHSPETPTDDDWNAYLELCRSKMTREDVRVLVVSAGGGPTPPQRVAIRKLLGERPVLAAVVTDAPMVHGIITVMGWSNPAIRTFSHPEGLEDALSYLGVDGAAAEHVRLEVRAMQRELA